MTISGRSRVIERVGIQLAALIWCALAPQFSFAYDHPLSSDAVREAYFLGQDVKSVNAHLAPYLRSLPVPGSGPYVAEIELRTPFVQVVEDSAQHSVSYSAQDAATAYQKRGDFIEVRVKVLFTPTYPDSGDDFWRGISVGLVQKAHIAAVSVRGEPIYAADTEGGGAVLGANVYAKFSLAGVKSDSLQVEVAPPEGPAVHATFDLRALR